MSARYPWPSAGDPRLPFPEPDHFDAEVAWTDYLAVCGDDAPQERSAIVAWTEQARQAIRAAWATGSLGDLPDLARRLHLDHERDASHRHYPHGEAAEHESVLARIGADLDPAIGNAAPDRLLGPWTTLLRMPRDRRLLQVATAAGALMLVEEQPFSPRRMWTSRKPLPDLALRDRIRAVAHSAFTVWPIDTIGDLWTLGPGVGTKAPAGPVRVPEPALLPGCPPPAPGDTLAARVVRTAQGPIARMPIVIPGPIPDAAEAWLDLLLLERRLTDRRAGPRDVLRSTGHVLVRRVLEAAWIR